MSSEEAISVAVNRLKIPFYSDVAPVTEYYSTGERYLPVLVFQLRDELITKWFEVRVSLHTGDIALSKDFKRGFTYDAIELPNKSPDDGFNTIVNPENIQSSPKGWTEGFGLIGNNVEVKSNEGRTFGTATRGVFSASFDPTSPPETLKNLEAGATNAFYVTNMVHDTLYLYGFTERAGNFQMNNFNKGGKEKDPIIITVQSSKETNNAHFYSPPDGQPGVLSLHLYTATDPNRDPALDNTILIHELTHGLSSRLTGGAHESLCMEGIESLGLSEGYSDIVALIFTAKPEDTRNTEKVIGGYVKGNPRGARTMMIQSCDPTFASARDAMIAADFAYYGGVNKRLIIKGFSKRGLGSIS
ncbi:hypothetical protein BASA60_000931 [Batrachochytrium salamandrivorans]|nr:hypothetical protein BASA60_000931 [Batrachochytrium salamandrivorans]